MPTTAAARRTESASASSRAPTAAAASRTRRGHVPDVRATRGAPAPCSAPADGAHYREPSGDGAAGASPMPAAGLHRHRRLAPPHHSTPSLQRWSLRVRGGRPIAWVSCLAAALRLLGRQRATPISLARACAQSWMRASRESAGRTAAVTRLGPPRSKRRAPYVMRTRGGHERRAAGRARWRRRPSPRMYGRRGAQ
eukprot:scaffold201033_cov30-Tisochrysis_lutea.AAC.2